MNVADRGRIIDRSARSSALISDRPDSQRVQGSQRVSVVFTVLNDEEGAVGLVEALLGQTRTPDEIVIIDGGASDGTHEALQRIHTAAVPLRYLRIPGINIAAGRNRGIEEARFDIIACTDAGCVPDANWLEELTRPLADPDVTVVGGAYRVTPSSRIERVAGLLTMPGHLKPIDPARFNPSARSIAFRVGAWRRAGGFPEWLYAAEDTLFDCKLRENGEVFAVASGAIVRWQPRSDLAAIAKQFRNYGRGEARIGRGVSSTRFWLRRYALACFLLSVSAACAVWTSNTPAVWAGVCGAIALLVGPVHRQAWSVMRVTFDPVDYPLAILLSHWIAIATSEGAMCGYRDRRRQPDLFVEPLRKWWGDASVGKVRLWRMKQTPQVRTLIVSWYWPPSNRASTGVLRNLFVSASPSRFRTLTRDVPDTGDDPIEMPPIPVTRVPWLQPDDRDLGLRTWFASIVATIRMVRAARQIDQSWPVQRVLAVYPNRYSLLAGHVVARALGVRLVAYMHDLFAETSISKSRLKRKFWTRVDANVLRNADQVIVPTERFAAHYRRRSLRRTWVLPHCTPPDVSPATRRSAGNVLRLVYAGSIYQAHEDAVECLLNATRGSSKVAIEFLTHPNRVTPASQSRWLSRAEALASIHNADVCVVALGHNTPYPREIDGCFPSKIVDYVAAGKPILAVVPPGSFVDELVSRIGFGISVASNDSDAIARAIERFRDPDVRRKCAKIARKFAASLDSKTWMNRLERQLSGARWAQVTLPPSHVGKEETASPADTASEPILGVTA